MEIKNNLDYLAVWKPMVRFNGALNPFRRLRATASGRRASSWKLLFYGCGVIEVTLVYIVVAAAFFLLYGLGKASGNCLCNLAC
jgi:hypothetical protein